MEMSDLRAIELAIEEASKRTPVNTKFIKFCTNYFYHCLKYAGITLADYIKWKQDALNSKNQQE